MADRDAPPYYSENMLIEGNMTADPKDISAKKDGSAVTARIACNSRNFRGEEHTRYRNIKVTNTASTNFLNSAKKGDRIVVYGRVEGNVFENNEGEEIEADNIIADFIASSFRFNEVKQLRNSGGRSHSHDSDDDDEEDDDDSGSSRRRSSSRRSSGSSSRRSSRRSSRVETRGDDDDDEDM